MAIEAVNMEETGVDQQTPGAPDLKVRPIEQDDFDRNVWCMLGVPVDIASIDQAVAAIDDAVRAGRRLSFVTPNVNWLVRAARDQRVRQEIVNADLSLVDGAPLAALARILKTPVRTRVAGSDLFEMLRRRPAYGGRRLKVFFFGGRDGAAEAAARVVNEEKGGVEAVGWLNPGFGDLEEISHPAVLDQINAAAPDFIVVALGAGKGQAWIDRNQAKLTAPVIAHLGAVVDFTAGGVQRAPKLMRALALEWAWRIKEDPALWRRYAGDALVMASILMTRFAPQWRLKAASAAKKAEAGLEAVNGAMAIRMSGDLHHPDLRALREAFRNAAAQPSDIILDFTHVASFDRAFLGLILMLEKHAAAKGAKLYLQGVDKRQMKVLKANDMRYPEFVEDKGIEAATLVQSAAAG